MSECRCILLCYLAMALNLCFILEQPGSAKFALLPQWQHFCQQVAWVAGLRCTRVGTCPNNTILQLVTHEIQVYRQTVNMRAFGAPSMKKTCLWSNSRLLGELGSDVVSQALWSAILPMHVALSLPVLVALWHTHTYMYIDIYTLYTPIAPRT